MTPVQMSFVLPDKALKDRVSKKLKAKGSTMKFLILSALEAYDRGEYDFSFAPQKPVWRDDMMTEENEILKIIIFVPSSHADIVREALGKSGAGKIGNYDFCSFSSKGIGRFRPLKGSNPAFGNIGTIEEIEEERIETLVSENLISAVLDSVKKVHPYEEPVIDIIRVESF